MRQAFRHRLVLASLLGIGSATLLIPGGALPAFAQERSTTERPGRPAMVMLASLQDAFAGVADNLEPAVCTVFSSKALRSAADSSGDAPRGGFSPFGRGPLPRRSTGTGSGVIISKDGWILTNDHVVGGADKVTVRLNDGREFVGAVRRDPRSDLALVKIIASAPLPTAKLGDSDTVKIGHWAIAIGSPYRYEGSFSVGVISSLYRQQEILDLSSPGGRRFYPHMLQTDAAINPGNSGGPLCNLQGEVIGINTAIESENGGSVGIGFAIPINQAKFVVKQLMEKGRVSYGYMGVKPTSVTPQKAGALKVEQGALVEIEPDPTTPAGKAGLQAGDVITAINATLIRNELDFRMIVSQTMPGTTVDMTYVRDGQKRTTKATLAQAEDLPQEKPRTQIKPHLGIEVQPLTEKLTDQFRIPAKTAGVLVKSIDPTSDSAEVEGLNEGVVILKVNDTPTPTVQAFQKATATLQPGDQVRIWFMEEGNKKFVIVSLD